MHPILFRLAGMTFYTQTFLTILAFIIGLLVAAREGKKFAIPRVDMTSVVLVSFLGAIVGARIFFLLLVHGPSAVTLREILMSGRRESGFSFHGGVIFGALFGMIAARSYQIRLWRLADSLAPGLASAMFFLRLGCLCNGCDYGVVTTVPWALPLYGEFRHPIQIYEGVGNLLLLPCLAWLNSKPLRQGRTFWLYLFLSSLLRFLVDFYRDDPQKTFQGMTIAQLIAGGLAAGAGGIMFLTMLKTSPTEAQRRKD